MAIDLEKELKDLKHRVDLTETRLSQIEGQFGFISGQLRDLQLFAHKRFDEIDWRLDGIDRRLESVDGKLDGLDGKLDGLPTIIAHAVGSALRGR